MLSNADKQKLLVLLLTSVIRELHHTSVVVDTTTTQYRQRIPYVVGFKPDRTIDSKSRIESVLRSTKLAKELIKIDGLQVAEIMSARSSATKLGVSSPKMSAIGVRLESSTEHIVANPSSKPKFGYVEIVIVAELGTASAAFVE
jgi:hypothetical protein